MKTISLAYSTREINRNFRIKVSGVDGEGNKVHSALKMTYYEAFSEARKALNSEEKAGSINEDIISQGNFDMKA